MCWTTQISCKHESLSIFVHLENYSNWERWNTLKVNIPVKTAPWWWCKNTKGVSCIQSSLFLSHDLVLTYWWLNPEHTHTLSKLNSLGQQQKRQKMQTVKAHNEVLLLVWRSVYTHAKSHSQMSLGKICLQNWELRCIAQTNWQTNNMDMEWDSFLWEAPLHKLHLRLTFTFWHVVYISKKN